MPNTLIRSFGKARDAALAAGLTAVAALGLSACMPTSLWAAQPASRLKANADLSARATLPQGVSKRAERAESLGSMQPDQDLGLMSLVLAPSATQSAALDQLLADQQNPASPRYHQWLTPEQFGESFGASDADLKILRNWLTSQGFTVLGVAPSRNAIDFTGPASAASAAFQTSFARFKNEQQSWFSNTTAPTVPSAFQGIIGGVRGLSSFRPQTHVVRRPTTAAERTARLNPSYTTTDSRGNVSHEILPGDIRQIYGGTSLFNSGYTGSGITIAVLGQTAVNTTQLANFQTLTGQTVKAPTLTLVPGTGASTFYAGDETEAESDIELASGVAPGATINYVYTGPNSSAGAFTALQYAITQNLGQILTLSYGGCEAVNASYSFTMEPYLRQASAQGQTFVVASGDAGAADCDSTSQSTSYDGLAVDYPASSPNATAVGGTTLNEGSGTYWSATNNRDNSSALGYIPETAWNESNSSQIYAGGGGISTLFSKPAWQAGTGVPTGNARYVPDVAFPAAANHDPYTFCSADPSLSQTANGVTYSGQCTTSRFGDFVAGGTSLGTPSFAGLLALVEQANGGRRLGNINPLLYSLAASAPSVFNDVTTGNNRISCIAGIVGCNNGVLGYTANPGYDPVTGLGSVNVANLSANLGSAASAVARTATLTLALSGQTATAANFLVTVGGVNAAATPTGTVALTFNNGAPTTLTLSTGATATYSASLSGLSSGTYTLRAAYSGDSNYAATSSTTTVTVTAGAQSLSLTATPATLTVTSGSSVKGSVTLNSANYTGLVLYTVAGSAGSTFPGCFVGGNGNTTSSRNPLFLDSSINAGSTATFGFTYYANSNTCSSLAGGSASVQHVQPDRLPLAAFAIGGLALSGLAFRRRRLLASNLLATTLLATAFLAGTLGLSGCGSGTAPLTGTTPTNTPTAGAVAKGTYNLVFTATSFTNSSLTGSTNVTVVVQ